MKKILLKFYSITFVSFLFFFILGCGPRLEPLPFSIPYESNTQAKSALEKKGLKIIPVSGTGSLAPLIPAHPLKEKMIVAYAGIDSLKYEELKAGMIVVYYRFGQKVIHRLGQEDLRGFIAFGIANEDKDRGKNGDIAFVTPHNYIGHVAEIALFPSYKYLAK